MCGIAGVFLRDPSFRVDLDEMLDTLLLEIESRGEHATGFVAIGDEGTLEWQKAACKASVFVKNRRWVPDGTRALLAHTRWATQGLPAFMENNHPIKRGPFFIIHNGHVNNDSDLFKEAERDRFGQVDSEAIAARLSHYGDLKFLGNVIEEIDGDAAVAAVDELHADRLVLARGHSSPLWVYNGKRVVVFGSTSSAVEKAYEKHIGRLKKDGAKYVDEGTMLFWQGDNEYWTKDLMIPKRVYKSYSYTPSTSHWTRADDDYVWGVGTHRELTTGSTAAEKKDQDRAIPFADRGDWNDSLDYGWIPCDNCGTYLPWADSLDLWDPDTKYTHSLCEDCYDMKLDKAAEQVVLEGEFFSLDGIDDSDEDFDDRIVAHLTGKSDTRELYSEYNEANSAILEELDADNRSILQMIKDRIQAK